MPDPREPDPTEDDSIGQGCGDDPEPTESGQLIGRVGSTGKSTGPHLHFEWPRW